jgi:TRAP-type C4-dicarboxylate transport system permease small subunit
MTTFSRIIRWIDRVCGIVAEGIVFFLMLLVTAEIIARHVLGSPIPGQVETATLSLVLILYLGLAYTQLERGHIRVELLVSRVKGKKRELLEAFVLFLSLIVSALMLWGTAGQARISVLGREFVTSFPVWPGRCAITFGFALLSFTLVIQICNHVMAAFGVDEHDREKCNG